MILVAWIWMYWLVLVANKLMINHTKWIKLLWFIYAQYWWILLVLVLILLYFLEFIDFSYIWDVKHHASWGFDIKRPLVLILIGFGWYVGRYFWILVSTEPLILYIDNLINLSLINHFIILCAIFGFYFRLLI